MVADRPRSRADGGCVSADCHLPVCAVAGNAGGDVVGGRHVGAQRRAGAQFAGLGSLAEIDTVVFDKTGTLTRDGMVVRGVHTQGALSSADALALAALLARQSLHPVSRALVSAAQAAQTDAAQSRWQVSDIQEVSGYGLTAQVCDAQGVLPACQVLLGSPRHAQQPAIEMDMADPTAPSQQVVLAWQLGTAAPLELARFDLTEDLRSEAAAAVQVLRESGVAVQLLSGDRAQAAARIAAQAGIAKWRGDCTPQDKLAALQALQANGQRVAMVGDGLNDGPVLAGAHVSFAFGRAVPLAQSRSDFVVLGSNLSLIAQSVVLARRTLRIVRQNLWWAAGYNALSVPLAIAGYMPAWLAGLGMALSSLLVVLNAARLSRPLPALGLEVHTIVGQGDTVRAVPLAV